MKKSTISKRKDRKLVSAATELHKKFSKLERDLIRGDEKLWRDACYKPNLQNAIAAGEIKQCPHCSIYFSPSNRPHECIESLKSKLEVIHNILNQAMELLKP